MAMTNQLLNDRDYTLILDKSGSMSSVDKPGGRSRWVEAQESTLALARKCEQFDPDGLTVYTFSSRHKRYDNVTASKVETIFLENDPVGSTNLAGVLIRYSRCDIGCRLLTVGSAMTIRIGNCSVGIGIYWKVSYAYPCLCF